MATLIDFDKQYMLYAATRLRGMGEIKDEELTGILNDTMTEWLSTKADYLGGLTPDEYFAEMSPHKLTDLMCEYANAGMSIPEPLYKRISSEYACAERLKGIAGSAEHSDAAKTNALSLLCGMDLSDIDDLCIDALISDSDAAEVASNWLKRAGYAVVDNLVAHCKDADSAAKAALLDVLSCYPGVDATADMLRERLYNDRDRRAMYAALSGRFGDDRLLEPLMRLSQLTDMEYYDYKEIINAIEMLGGDPGQEREFYGDPDYEALRVADTMPVNEET